MSRSVPNNLTPKQRQFLGYDSKLAGKQDRQNIFPTVSYTTLSMSERILS